MAKAKVAWFDFTCCEGCQIEMTNFGEPFLQLLDHVEPVEFREAMSETTTERINISFIEGSFSREADRARLEDIRKRSDLVVAYGACAVTGGVNALKNRFEMEDFKECVYGKDKDMPHLETLPKALPISAAIKVDFEIPGCPIHRDDFVRVVTQLVHGTTAVYAPSSPVCVECKLRETLCRYDDGDHCLGPIAKSGCGAICPSHGIPCEACRGLVDDANEESMVQVLMEKGGLSEKWAKQKSQMFTANQRGDA